MNNKYFAKLTSEETELLSKGVELAVLYAIKSFAGNEKHICFASERKIAERAKVAQDTVGRIRNSLITKGLIKNLGQMKADKATHATYHLKLLVNDSRSDMNDDSSHMNDSRSEVNDGASQVNDSKEYKHKGNINKTYNSPSINNGNKKVPSGFFDYEAIKEVEKQTVIERSKYGK